MERPRYDVFLSHMSGDKPAVEELARILKKKGIEPWLDKWNLVPGAPWQEAIEEALENCAAVAVCIGPSGTGPWQNEEMRAAIDLRVTDKEGDFRVIPVLLPGGVRGERSRLPRFLAATTWVEFRDKLDDEFALHRLVCGIRGIEPGPGPTGAVAEGACPFRGLEFFDVDDSLFFFGREALTEWLLDKLRPSRTENRFLAIVGPSGSGKSSLARAGLLAGIKSGELPGSTDWPTAILKPGAQPLESLAVALARTARLGDATSLLNLIGDLGKDARTLHLTTRLALHDAPDEQRIVVLVDQFEEIFTLCNDDGERQALIDNLLHAATAADGRTVVLLTLRADFYGRCAAHPNLAAALSDRQVLVGAMTPDELRRAVERPAALAGCELESGLAELLLEEVEGRPGSLPLLQHALLELWNRRRGNRLTLEAYHVIGGVKGALEKHAETMYEDLGAEQKIGRRVLLRLVQIDETTVPTRCRLLLDDLKPADEAGAKAVEEVVRKLADARLLTTGETGNPTVELAHEALITNWKRLKDWIETDREALLVRRRLDDALREWIDNKKDPSYLYRDARLAQAEVWASTRATELTRSEKEFLDASLGLRDAERRREQERARKLRRMVIALAIGFALALVAGAVAFWAFRESERQTNILLARNVAQQARSVFPSYPPLGLLLSTAAVRFAQRADAASLVAEEESLRWALSQSGGRALESGRVTAVAITPDHRFLVTAGVDGTAQAWDMTAEDPSTSGHPLTKLDEGEVAALSVTADRRWLLTRIQSGDRVRLFLRDLKMGDARRHLPEEDWLDASHPFSPDGRWLVTSRTGEAILWDLQTLTARSLNTEDIRAIAFSPDSRWLATAATGEPVKLRNPGSSGPAVPPVALPGSGGQLDALAFSPDGRWLAAAPQNGPVRVWRLDPEGLPGAPAVFEDCEVSGAPRFSLAAKRLLLVGGESGLCLWNLEPRSLIKWLSSSRGAELSADGRWLLAEDGKGIISFHRPDSSNSIEPVILSARGQVEPVRFLGSSPEGRWLVTQGGTEAPRLWDTRRGRAAVNVEPEYIAAPSSPVLAISADGRWIAEKQPGGVVIAGLAGRAERRTFSLGDVEPLTVWTLSAGGSWLANANPKSPFRLWRIANGELQPVPLARAPKDVSTVTFSPEGRWLAVGTGTGDVLLFDLLEPRGGPRELTRHQGVSALAFDPKGRWLATAGREGHIRRYDLNRKDSRADKKVREPGEGRLRAITSLAFSPAGTLLALADDAAGVALWDLEEREQSLGNRSGPVTGLAFSPDGRLLAGFSERGGAQIWRLDGEQMTEPVRLAGTEGRVKALTFSPDGRLITVASSGPTVQRWEPRLEQLLKLACRTAGRNLTKEEWNRYFAEGEGYREREPCPDLPPAR